MGNKRVTVNLKPEIKQALEEEAAKSGRTMAVQGGLIIEQHYQGQAKKTPEPAQE